MGWFKHRRLRGIPSRRFSCDCSGAVCGGELKFGMASAPSKPDIKNFILFSNQVRSLTYDVIVKYPHGHKISQLCNAANDRQYFSRRWSFQKVTSPWVLTYCVNWIFHAGHLRSDSGQSRKLARYEPMGGGEY